MPERQGMPDAIACMEIRPAFASRCRVALSLSGGVKSALSISRLRYVHASLPSLRSGAWGVFCRQARGGGAYVAGESYRKVLWGAGAAGRRIADARSRRAGRAGGAKR